jgi:hypothetical protein
MALKIYQMAVKYTNILNSNAFQNIHKLGFGA